MKKLFVSLLLVGTTLPALAQYHGHGIRYNHHHYHHRSPNWGPVIGGAILGAVIYDIHNRPVVVQQPPVIVHSPTITIQNCTPWTETQHSDGTITRTRTCTQ